MFLTPDGRYLLKNGISMSKEDLSNLYARVKNWCDNNSACPERTKVKDFLSQLTILGRSFS